MIADTAEVDRYMKRVLPYLMHRECESEHLVALMVGIAVYLPIQSGIQLFYRILPS